MKSDAAGRANENYIKEILDLIERQRESGI
jgi:hypothetical protein